MNVSYIKSALKPHDLPQETLPEVAVVGRSNCGKSSFINALLNHKKLARMSATPGRTQLIHFFDVDGRVIFADLPGYGFAKAPKSTRAHWQELMEAYLARGCLAHLVLLMDIRRKLDEEDLGLLDVMRWSGAEVHIVLTKADKVSRNQAQSAVAAMGKELAGLLGDPKVFAVSNLKKTGLDPLRELLVPQKTSGPAP